MAVVRKLTAGVLATALIGLVLCSIVLLGGCRKQSEVFVDTNLAPDTRLTSAPAPPNEYGEWSQQNYRVHLYWVGTDPDGYVAGYFYAWDDTSSAVWKWTVRTDSLFKALVDTIGETKRHTFYIRSVDNEGRLDPTPSRIQFEATTKRPEVTEGTPFRRYSTSDPDSAATFYDPSYPDTVLMGTPCKFLWDGIDEDGDDDLIEFTYRLDTDDFVEWDDVKSVTLTNVRQGFRTFFVKAKDEIGSMSHPSDSKYEFTMNYDPDTDIILPIEPSGTLTIPDGETITFTWRAHDKEYDLGVEGGGIVSMWIRLDTGFTMEFPDTLSPWEGEWYFTSSVPASDEHYISSINLTASQGGGNLPHEFRVWARDKLGRFETPARNPGARERYFFNYNTAPTIQITAPLPDQTVGTNFTAVFGGDDSDGTILGYQYVLDVQTGSWRYSTESSVSFTDVAPGQHELRVRCQDNSECWSVGYESVTFYVEE